MNDQQRDGRESGKHVLVALVTGAIGASRAGRARTGADWRCRLSGAGDSSRNVFDLDI
jgi:hypothetical protein